MPESRTFTANMKTVPEMMNYIAVLVENLPPQVAFNTTLVCEEILVNIASYAYPNGDGQLAIIWEDNAENREYKITFEDSGIPFNPLMREEPDLNVPIAERKIGGLGIMMVRKLMDTVQYTCIAEKNMLTITKVY